VFLARAAGVQAPHAFAWASPGTRGGDHRARTEMPLQYLDCSCGALLLTSALPMLVLWAAGVLAEQHARAELC